MAKNTAKKKKPLLTPEEKKTIRAARKILKRLTAKWEKLEEAAWASEREDMTAEDEFLDELYPVHIDFLDNGAFINLDA